jgi:hypothetical protein
LAVVVVAVVLVVVVVVVAGRGPVTATGKRLQSTVPASTAATAVLKPSYDGFGVPSAQSRPDCQPPSPASSTNMKLKNAPTAGWQ